MSHSVNHDMLSEPLCRFESVSKWYGPVIGLNDVTLDLKPGITGLVGHNGAGKSTLVKLLTGQLRPTLGRVTIRGRPAWSAAARRWIGLCPDGDAFYDDMSGRAFVHMMARLHGFSRGTARQRSEEVLDQVGMTDRAHRRLGSYSKGMRQRIKLAQALVHDPELLVLDEPLNGVDPVGRLELTRLFKELAARGKAVLVSSHILDELDTLADRVFFLCRGRLLASGPLAQVRAMLDDHPLKIRVTAGEARILGSFLMQFEMVKSVHLETPQDLLLEVHRPREFFELFGKLVVEKAIEVERLQVIDTSTEAVFDYLMQTVHHPW